MKKFAALLLALVLIISMALPAKAYGEDGHRKIIESILFGKENYRDDVDGDTLKKLKALEVAVTICLDQYNDSYSEELAYLNAMKVHGIPDSIDEINFTGNQYHRRYTHRGWDFSYIPSDKANWPVRKTILMQTVNNVFGFSKKAGEWSVLWFTKDYGYKEQCVSMAAFLYYLHIIGEYHEVAGQLAHKNNIRSDFTALTASVIPLANPHPGDSNPDLFWELEKHFAVIFATQKAAGTDSYIGLITDLRMLASDARKLASRTGGIDADVFEEYIEYAMKLIELLQNRIPALLQQEEFFTKAFLVN